MKYHEESINILTSNSDSKLAEYKNGIEKIINDLVNFGLTKTQAKVFIYLGKYGSKTSPEVCRDLKIARTETYQILNILTNLGIVATEFSHPARFTAVPMEKAIKTLLKAEQSKLSSLASKEIEISKLWNDIPCFFTKSNKQDAEKFQMLQGSPRIHNKMKNMMLNSKSGCKLLCATKDLSRFYYSNLIELFQSLSIELKLIVSSDSMIPQFMENMNKFEIRNGPKSMKPNQCFLIKDTDELLIFLRNANHPPRNIFAFWTDSKTLIDSIMVLFDYSWQNSTPLKQEKFGHIIV